MGRGVALYPYMALMVSGASLYLIDEACENLEFGG